MKYVLCLILGLSVISISQIGEASVPEATDHGEEIHQSVLRKIFIRTSEFLEYVNNLGSTKKPRNANRWRKPAAAWEFVANSCNQHPNAHDQDTSHLIETV